MFVLLVTAATARIREREANAAGTVSLNAEAPMELVSTAHAIAAARGWGLSCLTCCVLASSVAMESLLRALRVFSPLGLKRGLILERPPYNAEGLRLLKLPGPPPLNTSCLVSRASLTHVATVPSW